MCAQRPNSRSGASSAINQPGQPKPRRSQSSSEVTNSNFRGLAQSDLKVTLKVNFAPKKVTCESLFGSEITFGVTF